MERESQLLKGKRREKGPGGALACEEAQGTGAGTRIFVLVTVVLHQPVRDGKRKQNRGMRWGRPKSSKRRTVKEELQAERFNANEKPKTEIVTMRAYAWKWEEQRSALNF